MDIKVDCNKEIEKEYLLKEGKKIEGVIEILKELNPKLQTEELDKRLSLISNGLIENLAKKGNNTEMMKVVKNSTYKALESLLSEGYLNGQHKGELDYLAYAQLRDFFIPSDKNAKVLKVFSGWFQDIDQECKVVVVQIIQEYGSEKQKEKLIQKVVEKKKEKKKEKKEEKKEEPIVQKQEKKKKKEKDEVDPTYLSCLQSQKIVETRTNVGKLSKESRNILITSALPYVNNIPHLGNIIGCVLSGDVYSRFCRLMGHNSLYVCGTDEYGTATEIKARQEGLTPQQICDKYNAMHAKIYQWFDIQFDCFGRTSTPSQTQIAQDIFLALHKEQMLEENTMQQIWCEPCNMFLSDRYVKGVCPDCEYDEANGDQCDKCGKLLNTTELLHPRCTLCNASPHKRDSQHLFLKLATLQQELQQFVDKQSAAGNWGNNTKTITNTWLKQGLRSRCITRDLKWGTPVPLEDFQHKVFYVWFDAPIGYISITAEHLANWKDWWQNKEVELYQFMGKDNVPFHSVIFPSSLIGTRQQWTMVKHINTTEYLNYESGKFSKSRATGVFGDNAMDSGIPVECYRFYLLSNRPEKSDTVFEWKGFQAKINNELMQNVGNLCNRLLKLIYSKYNGEVEAFHPQLSISYLEQHYPTDHQFLEQLYLYFQKYIQLMEKIEIKESVKLSLEISSFCNKYMQDNAPWAKELVTSGRYRLVLHIMINCVRLVSALFEPFTPSLSAKINYQLNVLRDPILFKNLHQAGVQGLLQLVTLPHKINQPVILVNELPDELIDSLRNKYSGQQVKTE